MKCDCGYAAFYYQKFADNKKWNVYKCGHVMIESKRKTRCDMNICEYISEINCPEIEKQKVHAKEEKTNPKKLYEDNLQKYIYLCEITQTFSKKYRQNYIANINFLLRKFNFDLYFEEAETLESLKLRIKNKYVPRVIKKTEFPIKLTDYPDYLTVFKKEQVVIEKKKKFGKTKKKNFLLVRDVPEEPEEKNNPKEETQASDEESDSEDEDDNTFDIENCDSEEDYENFDDGGAFSD